MKKMNRSVRSLCLAAMIAALYLALTLLFQPISFGAVQFRISEAMTLLPAIFPEATIGLTLGCFLSNFLAGANVYDVVFGTLATLLAALISWRVGKKKLWYAGRGKCFPLAFMPLRGFIHQLLIELRQMARSKLFKADMPQFSFYPSFQQTSVSHDSDRRKILQLWNLL